MKIAGRSISGSERPFIIAELSGNHGGSLERALRIVELVADSGADAIKLQTYTADTMTVDSDRPGFVIDDPNSLWNGCTLHDLYEEAQTPWEWHGPIMRRAEELGLIAFSSPFDATAVDFLESIDVPCFKIASFEITDIPLIERVGRTGKPIILSTGLATRQEIETAVEHARSAGSGEIALLVCTSAYPAPVTSSNLATIRDLREWSGCEVGFSDHTHGIGAAVAAVALGASIIEKHVIDSRSLPTVDSEFSSDAHEFALLVRECRTAWEAVGSVLYGPTEAETDSLRFRRSIYFATDLPAGQVLQQHDLRILRPRLGLDPGRLDDFIGRRLVQDVSAGNPLRESDVR